MTTTSEAQGLVEQLDPAALAAAAAPEPAALEAPVPTRRSSRKSVLALSVCALAINGSAAVYTWPTDLPSLNVRKLAELFPRPESSAPKPDPVIAALKDIQAAQQQHTASLQENSSLVQQNAVLQQQDTLVLLSLRQSITDERVDVRKISSQLSTLIAKVDALQNTMMSDVTSSIRRANARYGLSAAMRKRLLVRESKPVGPVSVGGAPLTAPATTSAPES
ncbi:putative coiled-coil protein SlyX [Bradyrhizobium sp. cir1]|nr:putative coiled-coil protein SlyX [Bradyrhizobium sp. cir1]